MCLECIQDWSDSSNVTNAKKEKNVIKFEAVFYYACTANAHITLTITPFLTHLEYDFSYKS